MTTTTHRPSTLLRSPQSLVRTVLVAATVAGLAIDAYVHFDLASNYAPIKTRFVSQAGLFRLEAILAILAAIGVLLRPRTYTSIAALVAAAGGVAALLVYRYVNVGKIGPLPDMYEPVWFTKKLITVYAEGAATLAAAALLAVTFRTSKTIEGKAHG